MNDILRVSLIACVGVLCSCERPRTGTSAEKIEAKPEESQAARMDEKAEEVPPLKPISFNAQIQPILSENCYHCHGPDSGTRRPEKEPLRLDREKDAFAKREDGNPVIIKGDVAASLLVRVIESTNPEEVMPPPESHKSLTAEQIALVKRWVAEGAVYEEHWAFIPPVRPAVPLAIHPEWVKNPVDAFVQEKLIQKGLPLAPAEDPQTLIRRAALDLTGLLPDPSDVAAFENDPTDAAYTAMLEKYMSSTAYGEHRARYWLDYSRYADTHGLHFDNVRSIWPYRDYVIRSFMTNKRYDQFIREQLAGDLIPAADMDPWIATGYIRCNVSTNEGGAIPEEVHANNTRDRTEAFGSTFLGLTVGCAACHDHKFDPTAQRDFYALSAFFNNTSEKAWDENIDDSPPVLRIPPREKQTEFNAAVATRSVATANYQKRKAVAPSLFLDWLADGGKPLGVSAGALELSLRLDESSGDSVKNSAPGGKAATYAATVNPLIWGESLWLWPSMRMDINTEVPMADQGDFESNESFSASMWVNLRMKPANGTTGSGSLISRMGGAGKEVQRGWDLFMEKDKLTVNLVQKWPDKAVRVQASGIPRGEWVHLGFSYDGSGKAKGVKVFVNGELRSTTVIADALKRGQTIRSEVPLQLGRRGGGDPMRETSFQQVRLYRRALDRNEFARLPFEDMAAEILAKSPNPAQWSELEKFIALDRFFLTSVDPESGKALKEIRAADSVIEAMGKGGDECLITRERATPATAWVLNRGVYTARKELVTPATPGFLPDPLQSSNRLELAEWLFKPTNPLFARVTVNRMWQEVFGTGLVETSEDFGIMGSRPSNQALLDWLAVEFRESGWDLKHIYQLLLTSNAYRQSNRVSPAALAADPGNRLISRGPRFRMDAEVLRDTALQAAGLLARKLGGPPVKPYQPDGIWEPVSMPESNTRHYQQGSGEALYRRSMYSFWKRFAPPPSMETFDAQAREVVCVRRARTNTPLQALVSMNDPQFVEAARKLAERAVMHGSEASVRLQFLSDILLARSLSTDEVAEFLKGLERYSRHYLDHIQDAKDLLATGAAPGSAGLDPIEVASWTMVANQFLNLDETLTK